MIAGIMQPYFFPYIGYFQLIHSVDFYVNLDHVSFMKRSYMVRNTIRNGTCINLQVNGGSQNRSCKEVTVNFENKWIEKTSKTLIFLYKKEKNFQEIMETIIHKNFQKMEISVSDFNLGIIKDICNYLELKTNFVDTSEGLTSQKKADGLIEICKKINCINYVNAIGGTKLYDKKYFLENEVNLKFCKMDEDINLDNPFISILDLLFAYPKEHIRKEIIKYHLI